MEQGPDNSTYFGIFALISAASIALMTLMVGYVTLCCPMCCLVLFAKLLYDSMFYLYMVPTASIKMHKTLVNTVMRYVVAYLFIVTICMQLTKVNRMTLSFISVTDASSILHR